MDDYKYVVGPQVVYLTRLMELIFLFFYLFDREGRVRCLDRGRLVSFGA